MVKKSVFKYDFVKTFLNNSGGPLALPLVTKYYLSKGFSDEDVAKKLKLKVTEIRTALNRLHYKGVVEYIRKKNKNTGWYSYTWKINNKKILEYLIKDKQEEITKLRSEITKMQDYCFFSCEKGCSEAIFEIASQYNFICPDCGKEMNSLDSTVKIKKTDKKIRDTEGILKEFRRML